MKTRIPVTLLVLLCLACTGAFAQSYTISGKIGDSLNNAKLEHASITLVRVSDSVLSTFTRARADGSFTLHPDSAGKFTITISFPGMADYVDVVKLDKPALDLGYIPMVSKTHLLQELVVKQQIAAIKIKGDTTEYMADSFAVRENATVEELLKKLPGIQVNKNGEIVAQGEKVEKILVDGEEFFSDDPAVVTKNLQARSVEKVQVFDKKSDQAEFTGIDDGQKTKTINLQLKEDKKHGYFGKIAAGGGTDQFFENQGMINAFKGKRKLSAFGVVSNTDKIGLNWQDQEKFGGDGASYEFDEDGSMTTYISRDDDDFEEWGGKYYGQGLPKVWTGGLHYSNKWEQDKYHFGGNYRYAKQNLETEGNILTEYTLPGSGYFTNEHRDLFSTGQRHGADGLFEWKIDSTSSLKLTVNGNYKETQSSSIYNSESRTTDGDTLNTGSRRITSNASGKNENAELLYRKKFAKKGRTLSLDVKEQYKESSGTGFLNTLNRFYLPGGGFADSVIDQRKVNNSNTLVLNGKATYTEPLSKVAFLELNYALTLNNNTSERNSYDKSPGGEYTDSALNPVNSSNYIFNVLQHSGGANMRFVLKKINFSFGGSVANAQFRQTNLSTDTVYHRSFERNYTNLFPRVSFVYNFSKQKSFRFNYSGGTNQPTIDQIQPLRNNTDPLNTPVGNPDLKQEFKQTFRISYNSYKVLTGQYLWSSFAFSTVNNAISRTETVTPLGARTYQYINVQGNYNGWGYAGYGFKIKKLDLNMNVRVNANLAHNNNFINGQQNTSNNNSYGGGFEVRYEKEEKISISYSPGVTYYDNKSTISTYTTSYWTVNNEASLNIQLPKKFEFNTDAEWQVRQKTAVFDQNNSVLRWNAWISKKMLKKDALEIRASVFDILNQNVGFSRVAQNNYVTQDNYNTIRRYGMLSLIWNFTHTPAGAPAGDSPMTIIK
jgi:hypothetical protein